jgi:hypothetical protein
MPCAVPNFREMNKATNRAAQMHQVLSGKSRNSTASVNWGLQYSDLKCMAAAVQPKAKEKESSFR